MFSSLAISLALATVSVGAIPVDGPSRRGVTVGVSMAVTSSHLSFTSGNTTQGWNGPSLSLSVGWFPTATVAVLANATLNDGRAEPIGAGLRLQLWPLDRVHFFAGVELALFNLESTGIGFSGGLGVSVMSLKHHSLFLFARGNYVLNTDPNAYGHGENAATVQFGLGWQFH